MNRNRMRVNSRDGVSIAFQVTGGGEPALVFVHGFCCDRTYWDAQISYFAKRYTVITIDLAGHGESQLDRETWNSAAFGSDVASVVKKLDLKKVVLIGHSMGGGVIAETACRIPERITGLIGVDTFLNVEEPNWGRERADSFLASLDSDFVVTMRQLVTEMFVPGSDPALVEKVASDMSASPKKVTAGMVRDRSTTDRLIARCFDEIKTRIYCIASDMHKVDVDAARRHSTLFEVKYMSHVGHFLMMEDPEKFNRLLNETIENLTS
jgi:pimeloyl-ACP methyl ester carboxylesterase